ncbi:MAG: MG2 domain-containing protein [Chloroflexota bacterium]|nr:MG2 domain-containing protein [Chloroflexota bacterium]
MPDHQDMPHVEGDLLAYLDGELSPAEKIAVEAHLADCLSCSANLAELQALQAGLTEVVPAVYEIVQLSPEAAARIRDALAAERARPSDQGALAGLWDALVTLFQPLSKAAIPLIALFFALLSFNAALLPQQAGVHEAVVLGQNTFTPGTEGAVRVVVQEGASNQPIANAQVAVQFRQAGQARTVYTGKTDSTGSAPVQFAVPDDWTGDAELVVATGSDLGEAEISQPVQLARSYRLLLGSDKPVYQPGETIHMRSLALGKVDGLPAAGTVTRFEVLDPSGAPLMMQDVPASEFGITATDMALDDASPEGQYQLRAVLQDTLSELSVLVSRTGPPEFRVDVKADAPYYLPGNQVSGQVNAAYFFGKPVSEANVSLRLVGSQFAEDPTQAVEELFIQEASGQTDSSGTFAFAIPLPDLPKHAFGPDGTLDLALEATVTDSTGRTEFGWQRLVMAEQPILIDVVPEGGTLRSDVENILYVLTTYPDGRPAVTLLSVQIADGSVIQESTSDFGLAEVRYTPRGPSADALDQRTVSVKATDAVGNTGSTATTLPLDEAQETLLLRTDRAIFRVGDTLNVEVLATGAGNAIYLDLIKDGQTLMTRSAVPEDGHATVAIDLTPDLAGTLELNAYQVTSDDNILRDAAVVLVDAPEELQVSLATGRSEYRPGESANLDIQTDLAGQGVQAAVGLSVVNESAFAQREYEPGFARVYFLLDKALEAQGVDLSDAPLSTTAGGQDLQEAQQQSAKASWATYRGQDFTLAASAVDENARVAANQGRETTFGRLSLGLSVALVLIPLMLAAIVLFGLRRSGVLGQAATRMLLSLLILAVIGAGLYIAVQAVLGMVSDDTALIVFATSAALSLLVLVALILYGWQQLDQRAQYIGLLLLVYPLLLGLLAFALSQGADLSTAWTTLLAIGFGVLLAATLLFAWGLRLEGRRTVGALLLLLVVLLIPMVLAFQASDLPGGDLVQRTTGPSLSILQGNLLLGCATGTEQAAAPASPAEEPASMENLEASDSTGAAVETAQEAVEEVLPLQSDSGMASEPEATMADESGVEPLMEAAREEAPMPAEPAMAPVAEPQPVTEEEAVTQKAADSVAPTPALRNMSQQATSTPAAMAAPEPPPASTPLPTAMPVPAAAAQVTGLTPRARSVAATASATPTTATSTPTPQPTDTPAPPPLPEAAVGEFSLGDGGTPSAETPEPIPPDALPIIRQRFPQTLYWNPEIVTDPGGHARLMFSTGDTITNWRVSALAVDRAGNLGSASGPLVVFQPLFLEPDFPGEMSVGESLFAPVRIYNYSAQAMTVSLAAQATDGMNVRVPEQAIHVPANEVVTAAVGLEAGAAGEQTVIIAVVHEGVQDARRTLIQVGPGP